MVTAEEVMKALEGKYITIYLSAQTEEAENMIMKGFMRGYSNNWVVIQEIGEELTS